MSTKIIDPALAPQTARTPAQDLEVLDGLLAGIAEGGDAGVSPDRLVALVDAARAIAQSARAKLADADDADEESQAGIDHEYREQDDEADSYTGSAQEWADRRGDLYDLWRREI